MVDARPEGRAWRSGPRLDLLKVGPTRDVKVGPTRSDPAGVGRRRPSHAWTRGAVSARIHRMSAGVTKCHVGLSTWVRRIAPSLKARSTSASVTLVGAEPEPPFCGRVVLRLDGAEPRHDSAGLRNPVPASRWFLRRRPYEGPDQRSSSVFDGPRIRTPQVRRPYNGRSFEAAGRSACKDGTSCAIDWPRSPELSPLPRQPPCGCRPHRSPHKRQPPVPSSRPRGRRTAIRICRGSTTSRRSRPWSGRRASRALCSPTRKPRRSKPTNSSGSPRAWNPAAPDQRRPAGRWRNFDAQVVPRVSGKSRRRGSRRLQQLLAGVWHEVHHGRRAEAELVDCRSGRRENAADEAGSAQEERRISQDQSEP